PFSVTRGVMSVQEGDAYSGSVGTIADTNPDSSAANFSATFTFNGQSVPVTLAGSSGSYSLNVSNLGPFALSDSGARGTISVTEVGVTHAARKGKREVRFS
ncbi:MAG TPA: hypothetical protein VG326_17130, partial [Tepidisphaeraceae bacterium]|nr:hypothetical protein [Tepidisphaeraceae bacterium]